MAAEHEQYRLPIKYTEIDYRKMVGDLFPVGRIWGSLFNVNVRFIQDVISGASPEEFQDNIQISPEDTDLQDVTLNDATSNTSLFGEFISVFATELHRVEIQVNALLNESVPGLSTIEGLLPRWEEMLGLAGVVAEDPTLTETERQQAVHELYTNTGILVNEAYLIDYADSLGFEITIEYIDAGVAFIMGLAIMGLATFGAGFVDNRIIIHFLNSPTNIDLCVESFEAILPAHIVVTYVID